MRPNGEAIREIRRAKELTLTEIQMATGLRTGYLSELERGLKGARPRTLRKIAKALHVTVGTITRDDPS
jgi:transcriptional regulator with XRE-family HTH domain